MRILKSGIIPEYNFKCHICGCEFIALRTECSMEEIVEWPSTKALEFAFISCPDCKTRLKENKND